MKKQFCGRVFVLLLGLVFTTAAYAKTKKAKQVTEGTVVSAESGDIMCYLTVKDLKGKVHSGIGANFEICEAATKLLKKRVKLAYEKASVNDCESNEPCGKTKTVFLVSRITPVKK